MQWGKNEYSSLADKIMRHSLFSLELFPNPCYLPSPFLYDPPNNYQNESPHKSNIFLFSTRLGFALNLAHLPMFHRVERKTEINGA